MSYSVNGKVYTEHALMDEIVFNCKIILSEIIVKNDTLANYYETEESLNNATYYMMVLDGRMTFNICPFTYEILMEYGFSYEEAIAYLDNRNEIPVEIREDLVKFVCQYILDKYEERNDYYRSLVGLPPYGTTEYDIYITPNDFPAGYDKSSVDFTKPLHRQPNDIISVLYTFGVIGKLIEKYKYNFGYKYLRCLGDKKLDDYKIRRANKWDILYIPAVDQLVKDRFNELYYYNRKIYIDRYDQEAYEFNNEFYSAIMIINLIAQTFADMIVDIPEWYIRRDIFDMRSVQYFLESFGVAYYKSIPLRFQIRIVKSLNKLIKYKSSNRNNFDIIDIFGMNGTKVYKYYLYKKQLPDGMGGYVEYDPNDTESIVKAFDLEFIKTEINGTYDDHIKDPAYRYTYDEMTDADKYWDGEYFNLEDKFNQHKTVKKQHLVRDFIIEPTKLMTLETDVSMHDVLFQLEYFVGMITDSRTVIDLPADLQIRVPTIDPEHDLKLIDIFTLLTALSYSFDDMATDVKFPEDIEEDKTEPFPEYKAQLFKDGEFIDAPDHEFVEYYSQNEVYKYFDEEINYYEADAYFNNPPEGSITEHQLFDIGNSLKNQFWEVYGVVAQEYNRTWIEDKMPGLFYNEEDHHRVFGFNMEADLDWLQEVIGYDRHSEFGFKKGYTLEDLGVEGFIPPKYITSIEELNKIYNTNKAIYDHLRDILAYGHTRINPDDTSMQFDKDFYEYEVVKFVFRYLFTKTFDYNRFIYNGQKMNKYEEILYYNDYILYAFYNKINSEPNIETRRDAIRNAISDIITTLEYYLSTDGLEYIFSFTATNGVQDILNYIILMINFFKSYKVSFLDPTANYVVDNKDPLNNGDYARDQYQTLETVYGRWDKEKTADIAHVELLEYSWHYNYSEKFREVLDMYEYFSPDEDDDYDYNGGDATTEVLDPDGKPSSLINGKIVNGGLADPNKCIPWKMVDGGDASATGRLDLWDLDGGGAEVVPGRDEFDVDGGYPFHPDEYIRKDYFVSHFIADQNAGYSTTRLFRSETGITRMIDRNRKGGSERMSQYMYNAMIPDPEDHGYSMDNIWLDWENDWEHMDTEDLRDYKQFIDWYCVMLTKNIRLLDDDNMYKRWVDYCDQAADEPPYKIYHYTDHEFYRDKIYQIDHEYRIANHSYSLEHPVQTWLAPDPNPITSWTNDDI